LLNAGSVAAIVGASVAVLLLVAAIVGWWWREHHRDRHVRARIYRSGEEIYLSITGLPATTAQVAAFVSDGKDTKKLGPAIYARDLQAEHLFNLREGHQPLDESVATYKIEVFTTSDGGYHRRVFKKKLETPDGES
jgi:hypothetical protein